MAMSQIQQPGVTVGTFTLRGTEAKSMPSSPLYPKAGGKWSGDSDLNDLIEIWHQVKDRRSLDFSWTDKVEYLIVKLDHHRYQAILCPEQNNILRKAHRANGRIWKWQTGYASFTVEATTSRPYSPRLEDVLSIERNLIRRRKYLRSLLDHDQAPFTLNNLPDLEPHKPLPPEPATEKVEVPSKRPVVIKRSLSMYALVTSPGGAERETNSAPNSPTFKRPQLSRPSTRFSISEAHIPAERRTVESPILRSASRGLQVTFGCHDLREARYLHDQLCVLSPIMLAFTASTPVHRGRLSQFDVRLSPAASPNLGFKAGETCSLARPWRLLYPTYLTLDAPRSRLTRSTTNKEIFHRLRSEGLDDAMATFCAQGFACASPPVSDKDVDAQVGHGSLGPGLFERMTASLNPHVQLELPAVQDPRLGFRVKFGAMENQLTDFSNAACLFLIALLRFAILGFDLDFRLPPHMVAENIAKAHKESSIITEQFWWRSVRWRVNGLAFHNNDQPLTTDVEPALVSINHIINGDPGRPETVGLSGVLDAYLADVEDGSDAGSYTDTAAGMIASEIDAAMISRYLAFIRRRAKGDVWTDARLIRNFVSKHPEHQDGDVLSCGTWYDLIRRIEELNDSMMRGVS